MNQKSLQDRLISILLLDIFEGRLRQLSELKDFLAGKGVRLTSSFDPRIRYVERLLQRAGVVLHDGSIDQRRTLKHLIANFNAPLTSENRERIFRSIVLDPEAFLRWCFPAFACLYQLTIRHDYADAIEWLRRHVSDRQISWHMEYVLLRRHRTVPANCLRTGDFGLSRPIGVVGLTMREFGLFEEWTAYAEDHDQIPVLCDTFLGYPELQQETGETGKRLPSWMLAPEGQKGMKPVEYRLVLLASEVLALSEVLRYRSQGPEGIIDNPINQLGAHLCTDLLAAGYLVDPNELLTRVRVNHEKFRRTDLQLLDSLEGSVERYSLSSPHEQRPYSAGDYIGRIRRLARAAHLLIRSDKARTEIPSEWIKVVVAEVAQKEVKESTPDISTNSIRWEITFTLAEAQALWTEIGNKVPGVVVEDPEQKSGESLYRHLMHQDFLQPLGGGRCQVNEEMFEASTFSIADPDDSFRRRFERQASSLPPRKSWRRRLSRTIARTVHRYTRLDQEQDSRQSIMVEHCFCVTVPEARALVRLAGFGPYMAVDQENILPRELIMALRSHGYFDFEGIRFFRLRLRATIFEVRQEQMSIPETERLKDIPQAERRNIRQNEWLTILKGQLVEG